MTQPLLIFRKQHSSMIGHSDIEFRKISTSPSPLPLPPLGTRIGHPQNAKKRSQEILVQGVPNKPNSPIPHQTQKPNWVNPWKITPRRDPSPRIDPTHVIPLVLEAVPCVPVEWAGLIIDGFVGGVFNPISMEKIALRRRRGKCRRGWG